MAKDINWLIEGYIESRTDTVVKMLADTAYGYENASDEKEAFKLMVKQLFVHNMSKIGKDAFENGYLLGNKEAKRVVDYYDASHLSEALTTTHPGLEVKSGSN